MEKAKVSKNANIIGNSKVNQTGVKKSIKSGKNQSTKITNNNGQNSISNNKKNSINISYTTKNVNNFHSHIQSTNIPAQNNIISKQSNIKAKTEKRTSLKPKTIEEDNNIKGASDGKKEKITEKNRTEMPSNKTDTEKERDAKILKDKIKDFESQLRECTNKYSKVIEELNLLKQKLKDENNKNTVLKLNIDKIQEENKTLKDKINRLNDCKKAETKNDGIEGKKQTKNISSLKCKRNYDIEIRMESLSELINGWDIKYGINGMNNYIDMRNKDI